MARSKAKKAAFCQLLVFNVSNKDAMKVLFCTKHDLVGNMMLNLILPALGPEFEVEVLLANRLRAETALNPELGWLKLFEQELPARLLFPLIDGAPPVEGRWMSFQAMAQRYGARMHYAGQLARWPELTQHVVDAAPDLIVSFQFGFIFKPAALAASRLGAINLHSGALPERAGVNPTFWCMRDGATDAACTLHWIDHGIDSGPLVEVRRMPIDYSRSLFANWTANYRNGAQLIVDTVRNVAVGAPVPCVAQDAAARRYVPTPTPPDFAAFAARGCRLIDAADYSEFLDHYLPAWT